MPARTNPSSGLVVSFWRDDTELISRLCSDGEAAKRAALDVILTIPALMAGDRLTVSDESL